MTVRSWRDPRHPDHYHWITSRLDARGARTATTRIIATWMLVGGLAPGLIVFGATTSAQWPLRLTGLLVTIASVSLGLLWVRRTWPTRMQSVACAVIGALLAAVTCLILPNPLLGLMASAFFASVATYTAILHSWRLIAYVVTIAVIVIAVTAVWLARTEPAVAVGVSITNGLIIVYVTLVVRVLIGLIDTDVIEAEIEPTTGLLTREGLQDALATMIAARGRIEDRYLILALVGMDSFTAVTGFSRPGHARRLRVAVAQMLRETARRDAILAHLPASEFLLADLFTTPEPDPLCERIIMGVRAVAPELTVSIGVAVTPLAPLSGLPPAEVVDSLEAAARRAVGEVRSDGGNRSHIVFVPDLPASADGDQQSG